MTPSISQPYNLFEVHLDDSDSVIIRNIIDNELHRISWSYENPRNTTSSTQSPVSSPSKLVSEISPTTESKTKEKLVSDALNCTPLSYHIRHVEYNLDHSNKIDSINRIVKNAKSPTEAISHLIVIIGGSNLHYHFHPDMVSNPIVTIRDENYYKLYMAAINALLPFTTDKEQKKLKAKLSSLVYN